MKKNKVLYKYYGTCLERAQVAIENMVGELEVAIIICECEATLVSQ